MAATGVQLDVSKYLSDKEKEAVRLKKIDGVVYYAKKGFDPETGNPRPVLFPLTREEIEKSIEASQFQLDTFQQLLTDFDASTEA